MICPDCGHDNIAGDDWCDACGQPLTNIDLTASEVERTITRKTLRSLRPPAPIAIPPATSVGDAIRMLVEKRIGCLLVESRGEVVGIFTERDVLNRVSENPNVMDRPVEEFMTKSPTTVRQDDSIAYALHAMDLGGYRHLPVIDGQGKPTGIISIRDILGYLCDRFAALAPKTSS